MIRVLHPKYKNRPSRLVGAPKLVKTPVPWTPVRYVTPVRYIWGQTKVPLNKRLLQISKGPEGPENKLKMVNKVLRSYSSKNIQSLALKLKPSHNYNVTLKNAVIRAMRFPNVFNNPKQRVYHKGRMPTRVMKELRSVPPFILPRHLSTYPPSSLRKLLNELSPNNIRYKPIQQYLLKKNVL